MPKNIHVVMEKMNRVRPMMIMIQLIELVFVPPFLLRRQMPLSVLLRIYLGSLVVPWQLNLLVMGFD
jgi:hypothetical protein